MQAKCHSTKVLCIPKIHWTNMNDCHVKFCPSITILFLTLEMISPLCLSLVKYMVTSCTTEKSNAKKMQHRQTGKTLYFTVQVKYYDQTWGNCITGISVCVIFTWTDHKKIDYEPFLCIALTTCTYQPNKQLLTIYKLLKTVWVEWYVLNPGIWGN